MDVVFIVLRDLWEDLFVIIGIVSFILLPVGLLGVPVLMFLSLFSDDRIKLMKRWIPLFGFICIPPGFLFFFTMLIYPSKIFICDGILFKWLSLTFFSMCLFLFWFFSKIIKIEMSKFSYVVWFVDILCLHASFFIIVKMSLF